MRRRVGSRLNTELTAGQQMNADPQEHPQTQYDANFPNHIHVHTPYQDLPVV
jgi:hypothetical protein